MKGKILMAYRVVKEVWGYDEEFDNLDDLFEELVTDEMVVEWLNDLDTLHSLVSAVEVPLGSALYAISEICPERLPYPWDAYRQDFIQAELDYYEDWFDTEYDPENNNYVTWKLYKIYKVEDDDDNDDNSIKED